MPLKAFTFGVESRPGRYGPDGGARIINGYAEEAPADAGVPYYLYCRPGLKSFASPSGSGSFRGGTDLGEVGYFNLGATVQKVDAAGVVTNVGAFPGGNYTRMVRNRKKPDAQIALVSGGQRAILSDDTVTTIADTDLPAAIDVAPIGGYFVFAIADGRYFWTSIDEGTEIDALDFASAEANPDGLIGIIDRGAEEIVLAGAKTIEFHRLSGTTAVFARVAGTTLQLGCLSGAALQNLNGVPIFPASDATVRMLDAYSPQRISTHDVERDIDALEDKTEMTAFTFSLHGHQYYALSSADWTWVCDLLTRLWFRWESYGKARWRAAGVVDVGGKRVVGVNDAMTLYEIDPATQTDAGDHLIWKLVSKPFGAFPQRVTVNALYLNLIPGVGLNSSDAHIADPEVMLRVSRDDGKNWGNARTAAVGKLGKTRKRTKFTRLGTSGEDGFRFEVSMSAPVSRGMTGSAVDYDLVAP